MARNAKSKRKRAPKTVLKLPDLEQSKSAVLNSLTSPSSQSSYDHAIREFIDWYCSEPRLAFNKTVLTRYRISLEQRQYPPSTINLRLAAVRRLAYEAADCGLLSPDLAAGIRRVKLGVRIGNWLTAEEGRRMIGAFGASTLKQHRNRAMIAVLIGCGLRRAEVEAPCGPTDARILASNALSGAPSIPSDFVIGIDEAVPRKTREVRLRAQMRSYPDRRIGAETGKASRRRDCCGQLSRTATRNSLGCERSHCQEWLSNHMGRSAFQGPCN